MTTRDTDLAAAGIPAVAAKAIIDVARSEATELNEEVVETANTALSTANTALSTASTASSTATTATTTASSAVTTATAAETTADAAEASVTSLESTYDSLNSRLNDNEVVDQTQTDWILGLQATLATLEARIGALEEEVNSPIPSPATANLALSGTAPAAAQSSPSASLAPARRDLVVGGHVPAVVTTVGPLSFSITVPRTTNALSLTTTVPGVVTTVTLPTTMTATFTGLSQGTVIFQEATAADGGIIADTTGLGTFVQQHKIATSPSIPGMKVHFARDQAGGRREVWVYYGQLMTQLTQLGAHTVTIQQGATTLATVSVSKHVPRTWWRTTLGSGPRPVIRTIAQLIAARLLPPYGGAAETPTWQTTNSNLGWPAPMATSGITQNMGATGERMELGVLPDPLARHCYLQDNLNNCHVYAEMMAAIPMHWIDEATGAPFEVYNRPLLTSHSSATGSNLVPSGNGSDGWNLDVAHGPNFSTVSGLMTGDPFHTLMAQGAASYGAWQTNWQRFPSAPNYDIGPHVDQQTRGRAWMCRDWLVAWLLTPNTAPSWLAPRSYYTRLMTNYATYMRAHISGASGPTATLHLTLIENSPSTGVAFWQENFFASVLGWWAWAGGPGSIYDIFEWKADCAYAQASGRDGCNIYRANTTYWVAPDIINVANSWDDILGSTQTPPLAGDNWYANYGLGVLNWLVLQGFTAATSARNFMATQVAANMVTYGKYAWTDGSAPPPPAADELTGAEITALLSDESLQPNTFEGAAVTFHANGVFDVVAEPNMGSWSIAGDLILIGYAGEGSVSYSVQFDDITNIVSFLVGSTVIHTGTLI